MDAPRCTKSNTDSDDPIRAKLLMEMDEPRWVYSITDKENKEPKRAKPNNDTVEPNRR
jgi:hypothetical protein